MLVTLPKRYNTAEYTHINKTFDPNNVPTKSLKNTPIQDSPLAFGGIGRNLLSHSKRKASNFLFEKGLIVVKYAYGRFFTSNTGKKVQLNVERGKKFIEKNPKAKEIGVNYLLKKAFGIEKRK